MLSFLFYSHFRVSIGFFFFSSRRRHTRFSRDWSSDVCSSDLAPPALERGPADRRAHHLPADCAVRDGQAGELDEAAIAQVQVDVAADLVALELPEADRLELEDAARVLVEVFPATREKPIAAFSAECHVVNRSSRKRGHDRDGELLRVDLRDEVDGVPDRRARLVGMAEDELAPHSEAVGLGKPDCTLDLFEGDALLDLSQHLRIARLHAELERLEVRGLEQADEFLVDAIDSRLRREVNSAVEVPGENPLQDRLGPPHVQPERLVLDANPLRLVALEDLLDLFEDVGRSSVPRLEAGVVAAEHALERTAPMGDQR